MSGLSNPIEFSVLQKGTAKGVTSAAPFQLRNIQGGFNSHILQIKDAVTTAGTASFSMISRFYNGAALDGGASDYFHGGSNAKQSEIQMMEVANDVIGSWQGALNLTLVDFLDNTKISKMFIEAGSAFLLTAMNSSRSNFFTGMVTAKAHSGLDIYPTANTISFNWRLIGRRTL